MNRLLWLPMNKRTIWTSALILASLLGAVSARAAGEDPGTRARSLVSAFLAVKPLPAQGTLDAAQRKANEAAFAQLDSFFDYTTIVEGPVTPHRSQFSAEQLEKYRKGFRELVRLIAYPDSGSFFREAKIEWAAPKIDPKKADVTMKAFLPEQDLETSVTFHWAESGGTWRIVDVSFDGSSLIKDYQNQFGRILEKEKAEGLLKRIETRLQEEKQKRAGLLP